MLNCPDAAIAPAKAQLSLDYTHRQNNKFGNVLMPIRYPGSLCELQATLAVSDRHQALGRLSGCLAFSIAPPPFTRFAIATSDRGDRPNQFSHRIDYLIGVAQECGNQQNPDQRVCGVKWEVRSFGGGKCRRDRRSGLGFDRIHHG